MILDNVNPDDLFPTEKKGPSVLGIIEYSVQVKMNSKVLLLPRMNA